MSLCMRILVYCNKQQVIVFTDTCMYIYILYVNLLASGLLFSADELHMCVCAASFSQMFLAILTVACMRLVIEHTTA